MNIINKFTPPNQPETVPNLKSQIWDGCSGGRFFGCWGGRFFKLPISDFGARGGQNIITMCENDVLITPIYYASQTNENNAGKNFVKPKPHCKRSVNDPPTAGVRLLNSNNS